MNWDQYKDDQILKGEIDHRSIVWDNEREEWSIEYTDIKQSEILKKQTSILTDVCRFTDALICKRRAKLTVKSIKDISFEIFNRNHFTNEEAEQCQVQLFKFYTLLRKSLSKKTTWVGFASLFDLISGYNKDDNYLLEEVDNIRFSKLCKLEIQDFTNSVFLALTIEASKCKDQDQIFSNLALFSNEELILKFKQIRGKEQGQLKFHFLIKLRDALNSNKFSNFYMHLIKPGEVGSSERECYSLLQWIDTTLLEIRPSLFYLEIRTENQKEILRTFFQNQVESEIIVINDNNSINEDIDLLVNSRTKKKNTSKLKEIPSSIDFDLKLGPEGKASQLISKMFVLIRNFKTDSLKQDIQYWIFQLFINSRDRGFSFAHIIKCTYQKKEKFKTSHPTSLGSKE